MNIFFKSSAIGSVVVRSAWKSANRDIQIDKQADPKARFDGYQSYAWLASSEAVYDPDGQWEPKDLDIDSEIRFVINENLRKRGMLEVVDNPDMLIVFSTGLDMAALDVKENPDTKQEMLVNVPKAGLVIGFVDADTGFLIWRGLAVGEAEADRDIEDIRKRIEYAIKEMFKQIP